MGDKPKPKFFSRLLPHFRASHENRSTVSLPPPVAAPTPIGSPDARPSSVTNIRDATSDPAPTCLGLRKALSKFKVFLPGRRQRPGAVTPSPATPSLASPPLEVPTPPPPKVLPSSPPASLTVGAIPFGDPSVVSDKADPRHAPPPPERAQIAYDRGALNSPAAETIGHVSGAVDAVDSSAGSYGEILSNISAFSDILTALGEVHPYLKVATSAINGIVTPIIKQVARDEKFQALLEQMSLAYDLVIAEFGSVARRKARPATRQMKLLHKISVESQQCAGFIENEYIGTPWARVAKNIFKGSKVDETVDRYTSVFSGLRTRWHAESDRSREAREMLEKLPRIPHAGHTSQKACLGNTRIAVLKKIDDWVDNPASPRALFVLGVAGSGKSTVAHTVAGAHEDLLQLGSFFAFSPNDTSRTPQRLLGTVAYNLAQWDEGYRDELVRILKDDPKLADSPDIMNQWNQLIVGPAALTSSPGRILIVIDAFDECPGSNEDRSRQHLLDCLTRHAVDLPDRFRVLVTSRPLHMVSQAVNVASVGVCDFSNFPATEDIRAYVRSRLLKEGLGECQCDELAGASDGLFQWAATACSFLLDRLALTTLSQKFKEYRSELLHGASGTAEDSDGPPRPSLDALYKTVLQATFFLDSKNKTAQENALATFRSTVAIMLCAEAPLSIDILQSIYDKALPTRKGKVKDVLGSMGVVLEGASSTGTPLRPMHLTFREFLLDASRSALWHISEAVIAHGHRILALGGLRIMASDLRFNMHTLPSSLSLGVERESEPCPHPALAYITSNLCTHLSEVLRWGIGDRNCDIFRRSWQHILYNKLLFWMEWSQIHGGWYEMGPALVFAQKMITGKDCRFSRDALCLGALLHQMNVDRPAHVYLSGLAFAPEKSLVRQHFMCHFRGIPTVSPLRDTWESSIQGAPRTIWKPHMAWSSDCRYIRENGSLSRCWDAQTGDAVDVPPSIDWRCAGLASADGRVKVSLSPVSGKLAVNVERSLIACPANTTPVLFTIETGSYGIDYNADVSPDGNWLVIVDSNGSLKLWDLGTGLPAWKQVPREVAREQLAATFSPDSREVVSSGRCEDVHCVFPIDRATYDGDIQTVRWVNVNFKPQPKIDDNGVKFPDADLRCAEPDICVPINLAGFDRLGYDHLVCGPGVRLVLGDRLTVDYTDACYGTEWARCYAGTIEAEESEDEYAGVDVEMEECEVESFASKGQPGESEDD